jgi:hypothetical protein
MRDVDVVPAAPTSLVTTAKSKVGFVIDVSREE